MVKHVREGTRSQPAQGQKVKVKAWARENIQEKGTTSRTRLGSPNEDGQRTLGDFGLNRQRVQFVGDVHGHDDWFETPRGDRAVYVFCVLQLQKRHGRMSGMCQVR